MLKFMYFGLDHLKDHRQEVLTVAIESTDKKPKTGTELRVGFGYCSGSDQFSRRAGRSVAMLRLKNGQAWKVPSEYRCGPILKLASFKARVGGWIKNRGIPRTSYCARLQENETVAEAVVRLFNCVETKDKPHRWHHRRLVAMNPPGGVEARVRGSLTWVEQVKS